MRDMALLSHAYEDAELRRIKYGILFKCSFSHNPLLQGIQVLVHAFAQVRGSPDIGGLRYV